MAGPTATGANFRGQQRKNDTHASKTDPDARLYRKSNGAESRLAYLGHLLIENRHGLIADAMATHRRRLWRTRGGDADGARAVAARARASPHASAPTRRYDTRDFVELMRELDTTPHVTQNLDAAGRQRD